MRSSHSLKVLVKTLAVLLLASCGQSKSEQSNPTVPQEASESFVVTDNAPAENDTIQSSVWNTKSGKDPMTDDRIEEANSTFLDDSGSFEMQISVRCKPAPSGSAISVRMSFFKSDGLDKYIENLDQKAADTRGFLRIRIDNNEPENVFGIKDYSNSFYLESKIDPILIKLFSSNKIIVQPKLANGNPTFFVNTNDENFINTIKPCSDILNKKKSYVNPDVIDMR